MSSTASSRTFVSAALSARCASAAARRPAALRQRRSRDRPSAAIQDDFHSGLGQLAHRGREARRASAPPAACSTSTCPQASRCGSSRVSKDRSPSSSTRRPLSAGGPNDQVSDLNVFWMASNVDGARTGVRAGAQRHVRGVQRSADLLRRTRRQPQHHLALPPLHRRSGTRARCCPEHDLATASDMLVPNRRQTITLIANGKTIEYRRDGTTALPPRRPCALHEWLVCVAHHLQPSAHRTIRVASPVATDAPARGYKNPRKNRAFLLKGGGSAYIMRAPGQGTRKSLPSQTIFEHR